MNQNFQKNTSYRNPYYNLFDAAYINTDNAVILQKCSE